MAKQLSFNNLSTLHKICTDFIDDPDVLVGMQNNWIDMCTVRYKITGTNDFDLVLDEMRRGFGSLPIKREVIYPIFLKVMNITEDIFWKEIMEDLAYGVAPVGTYISKGVLCCNQSSKEFVYRFIDKDPQKIKEDTLTLSLVNSFFALMKKSQLKKYGQWWMSVLWSIQMA
jgi:hypothetical protein